MERKRLYMLISNDKDILLKSGGDIYDSVSVILHLSSREFLQKFKALEVSNPVSSFCFYVLNKRKNCFSFVSGFNGCLFSDEKDFLCSCEDSATCGLEEIF